MFSFLHRWNRFLLSTLGHRHLPSLFRVRKPLSVKFRLPLITKAKNHTAMASQSSSTDHPTANPTDCPNGNPKVVIILSGKRKSGKDYVANLLQKNIQNFVVIRIAGPIKSQYAKLHNLNYEEMLSDSQYKEQHRLAMVTWSTEVRQKDQNFFLRISIEENEAHRFPIWILTDARRKGDIDFFEHKTQKAELIKIRVTATQECRKRRGFVFTDSIDNAETECGLDSYDRWTLLVENEDLSDKQLLEQLRPVLELCNSDKVMGEERPAVAVESDRVGETAKASDDHSNAGKVKLD